MINTTREVLKALKEVREGKHTSVWIRKGFTAAVFELDLKDGER